MGVYIKGIEMPETCIECMNSGLRTAIRCTEWTEISAGLRENHRALSCHLTEVPEPHGKLVEFIDVTTYEDGDSGTEEVNLGEAFAAYFKMREAKPVIEAEGTNEGSN